MIFIVLLTKIITQYIIRLNVAFMKEVIKLKNLTKVYNVPRKGLKSTL